MNTEWQVMKCGSATGIGESGRPHLVHFGGYPDKECLKRLGLVHEKFYELLRRYGWIHNSEPAGGIHEAAHFS